MSYNLILSLLYFSRRSTDPETAVGGRSRAAASSNKINNNNDKKMGAIRKASPTSASSNNNKNNLNNNDIKLENNFMCPVCSAAYKTVTALEHHVEDCLEG